MHVAGGCWLAFICLWDLCHITLYLLAWLLHYLLGHITFFHDARVLFNGYLSLRSLVFIVHETVVLFVAGMIEMLRKINLSRAVRTMQELFPEEYDFYPRSWILPEECQQFSTQVCLRNKSGMTVDVLRGGFLWMYSRGAVQCKRWILHTVRVEIKQFWSWFMFVFH